MDGSPGFPHGYHHPGMGIAGGGGGGGGGGPGPSSSSSSSGNDKYTCPNCGKAFARDDLLRRHLAREARAQAQPQFDRQKSCYECARSKARCDLAVPSCGRCRSRGKTCHYGVRSGNPNVRRHRESMGPPNNLAGMSISGHDAGANTPYLGQWHPGHHANDSLSDTSHSSHSSHAHTPRRYSGSESESESGGDVSWADGSSSSAQHHAQHQQQHHSFDLERPSRTSSLNSNDSAVAPAATNSYTGQGTAAAAAAATPFHVDNAVTPTTYLANAGFGGPTSAASQRPTQSLMTDLDRSAMHFKNDDGEETPIGRLVNSFGAGPSPMDSRSGDATADFLARQRAHAAAAAAANAAWANQATQGTQATHGPQQQQQHVNLQQQAPQTMGPPSLPYLNRAPLNGAEAPSPAQRANASKPQPHRLLTGANMPQPTPTSSSSIANNAAMNPMSGRPLFSAMVDLSGWLEEPVVPSPLYPTGPSLASLMPHGLPSSIPPDAASMEVNRGGGGGEGGGGGGISASFTQSLPSQPPPQQQQQSADSSASAAQMPASRYWWANPPSQSDALLMHSVAQATASHLSHYPHLMVLPDPSSPVPPTVHRPWMAHIRGNIPAPLAIARVVLAGFAVRLPASEHVVWEGVARETQRIVVAHEAISHNGTDLEVFGATVALFFYCILLMMCTDAGATGHVTMELTNAAFFGLSQLAKSLSARLQNAQNRRAHQQQQQPRQREDWMSWGFEETMRRTLWAAYAILVLQRFRDGAILSEGHLAGIDLLLDIQLPAVAAEFEAGSEDEWRKARGEEAGLSGGADDSKASDAASDANAKPNATSSTPSSSTTTPPLPTFTFRDLIIHRPRSTASTPEASAASAAAAAAGVSTNPSSNIQTGAEGTAPPALLEYFDRHDAFVATVLSIAFCLDSSLTT